MLLRREHSGRAAYMDRDSAEAGDRSAELGTLPLATASAKPLALALHPLLTGDLTRAG